MAASSRPFVDDSWFDPLNSFMGSFLLLGLDLLVGCARPCSLFRPFCARSLLAQRAPDQQLQATAPGARRASSPVAPGADQYKRPVCRWAPASGRLLPAGPPQWALLLGSYSTSSLV